MPHSLRNVVFWLTAMVMIGALGAADETDWVESFVAPAATGVGSYALEFAPVPGAARFGVADSMGNGAVRYFEGAGDTWSSSTVAVESLASMRIGLAFEPVTNVPYVAYAAADDRLRVAFLQGASWTIEDTLTTGTASGCSIAFDPATSQPAVAGGGSGALWFSWRDASGWHVETIDSGFATNFREPSLQFDPVTGEPCVAWARSFQGPFFGRRVGGSWQISQVESATFPYETVLRFRPNHHAPQVLYRVAQNGPVHYAVQVGAGWETSAVAADQVWFRVGFDNQTDGMPWVAYPRGGSGTTTMIVKFLRDGRWIEWDVFDTGGGNLLWGCRPAIRDGVMYLAYHASGSGLRVAQRLLPELTATRGWMQYQ